MLLQVALYTEKYEEFQGTLQKSNDVFQSFKVEMDKVSACIWNNLLHCAREDVIYKHL